MIDKALVTGATGFVGKYLVNYLLNKQINVRALVRNNAKSGMLPEEIEIVSGDLTKPTSLLNICNDVDTVFHLGGYAHAWGDHLAEARTHHEVNFKGTQNMMAEAVRANVKRFIYFSSVKAVADTDLCINEQWSQPPDSPYGIAKREAEKWVLATGKQTGMHVTVLRPALVYGPEWKGNLASMLRAIDKGFFLPIPKINNHRSLVSIDDICQAALLAAINSNASSKIYFVTDGIYYSTHQLYVLMSEALGKPVPKWHIPLFMFKLLAYIGDSIGKFTGRRMPFNSEAMGKLFGSAQYNSEQIQKELGFKPNYDFKKMLPDIVAAYKL